jgi:hypothetical protein
MFFLQSLSEKHSSRGIIGRGAGGQWCAAADYLVDD